MAHNTAQSSDNDEEVSAITEPREPTLTTIIPITRCGDPEDNPVPFTRQTEEKPAPAPKREPAPAPQKASPPPGWPRSGPVPPRTPAGGLQRSGSLRRSSNNSNNNSSSTGSSSLARSSSLRVKRPESGEAKARVPQSPATARRTAAAASAKLQRTPSLRRKAEAGNNNSGNNNNISNNNISNSREADKEDKPFVRKLHTRESLRRRAREAADKASVEKEETSSANTAAGPVNTATIPIRRLTNNNHLHPPQQISFNSTKHRIW